MKPYAQIAADYCADVLAGRILACKWVRLACERQVNDLHRAAIGAADFPYFFDEAAAGRVCLFIEKLPHIKGPLAGQLIALEPWQVFILTTVFGWLKTETKKRRYRRVYIEVPRGNGKSALSSGVALYMLAADKEGGPEVYSAATTKDQARIVFDVAQKMLRTGPGRKLAERFGLVPLQHSISHPASNGVFVPVSSDAMTLDGGNTHFACLDELHAHKTSEVWDVFDTSTGKRDQSMLWTITTAGVNMTGICYTTRDYAIKILQGVFHDEMFFGIVYTIDGPNKDIEGDTGDDWTKPEIWKKANPNYGVSVFPDDLAMKAQKAMQQVSAQTNFKTKHLDMWQAAGSVWMDMRRFGACADPTLKESDFVGQKCVVGMDLASKLDLLSQCRVFWKWQGNKRHYYVFWKHWTPEQRILDSPIVAYRTWEAEGRLITCPGETNDFTLAEEAIREAHRTFDLLEVAHDPAGALEMSNKLLGEGIPMVEVGQVTKYVSPAAKELEAAIYDGRFHYDGDPVVTWAMSNVVVKVDKNDNIFPFKLKAENKIDPIVALDTALIRIMDLDSQPQGDDTSIFGPCAKCGTWCGGELVNEKLEFICVNCKKALDNGTPKV